jgi:hypothetical protein
LTSQLTNTTVCQVTGDKQGVAAYDENVSWQLDKCTKCLCKGGLVLCSLNKCPPMACLNPIFPDRGTSASCCPVCPRELDLERTSALLATSSSDQKLSSSLNWSCIDWNEKYREHGSTWKETECRHCICLDGETRCLNYESYCPKTKCSHEIFKKTECCPVCIDSNAPLANWWPSISLSTLPLNNSILISSKFSFSFCFFFFFNRDAIF